MTAGAHTPRRRSTEAAIALPIVVVLSVVAMALMVGATSYSLGRLDDHDRRRDRVVAMPVLDSALTRIKLGLEQNLLAEHRDYRPTDQQLQRLVAGGTTGHGASTSGAQLIPGSPVQPPIPAGMPNFTVRENGPDGISGFWQMLHVFSPEYHDTSDEGVVVVYLRAWNAPTNAPAQGTEPRLVRAEFRPGRFADYQAVIDGPILFGQGAALNGPIHSNGFADERFNFRDALLGTTDRVATIDNARVACTGAAQITTATGNVETTAFPGCPVEQNTGRFVNLLAAEEAFTRIRKACAERVSNVRCYDQALFGSSVPSSLAQRQPDLRGYRVHLNGTSLRVSAYEIDWTSESPRHINFTHTIPTPRGSTTVLYFADNVLVEGTTVGRVTIAARKPGEWSPNVESGSANIYLTDDTHDQGGSSVLGLMAQGGVILDAIKRPNGTYECIDRVSAGIVAMSGTLTIDPRYTTRLYQSGGPQCGPIDIDGSLAAHRSPVLYWTWANRAGHAGYSRRDYRWNRNLRRNPPPYFPTTDTWEARHVRPVNVDCFSGGRIVDQDC